MAIGYEDIKNECEKLLDLLARKNADYGNSFQEQYNEFGNVSSFIRLTDKMNRLKRLINNKSQVDESLVDTLRDLAGYAIMTIIAMEQSAKDVSKEERFEAMELALKGILDDTITVADYDEAICGVRTMAEMGLYSD